MTVVPRAEETDARHLWATLARLRFEVEAAVSWIRADAEPSVALHRLDRAAAEAEAVLTELAVWYSPEDSMHE